jgi:hypothetical protein
MQQLLLAVTGELVKKVGRGDHGPLLCAFDILELFEDYRTTIPLSSRSKPSTLRALDGIRTE